MKTNEKDAAKQKWALWKWTPQEQTLPISIPNMDRMRESGAKMKVLHRDGSHDITYSLKPKFELTGLGKAYIVTLATSILAIGASLLR